MGMVVVEGDVFAVDNRELKKRRAWVVAFDMTDYTGSIRVNKFFPGEEGKPLVDGIKKGMHIKVQGRLNMDRFYGDMVLEPVAVAAAEKRMKEDTAPEKRVELHLHTTLSSMDALTSVNPKLGPDKNVVKRAESWGHPAIAITDHGVAQAFPEAWHSAKKIKLLYGVEAYYINDMDDRVAVHGDTGASFSDEIVCFDLETTGLSAKWDAIIEIGAVVLKNGEITDTFNTFAAPGRILPPEIIRLTGITDEMVQDAPLEGEALERVGELLKKAVGWVLGGLLTVFVTYLTISGAVAGAADAHAVKLAKSAVSAAVPVVGGILSDAAESVLAGAGLLRGMVGTLGTLALLGACLTPFLHLGCQYLFYQAASLVSAAAGPKKLTRLIAMLGDAFALVLAMTGTSAVLLLISLLSSMTALAPG